MYRRTAGMVECLLVHPGGPLWAKRDLGAWSIPKGEYSAGEDALSVAIREFEEETGVHPLGPYLPLGELVQPSRKRVMAWAAEGELDTDKLISNTFELEWPPRSGHKREFPEVDRAEWLSVPLAERKILRGQLPFVARLVNLLT